MSKTRRSAGFHEQIERGEDEPLVPGTSRHAQPRQVDPAEVIDEILRLSDLELTASSYEALADFSRNSERWERSDLFHLVMLAPELQVA